MCRIPRYLASEFEMNVCRIFCMVKGETTEHILVVLKFLADLVLHMIIPIIPASDDGPAEWSLVEMQGNLLTGNDPSDDAWQHDWLPDEVLFFKKITTRAVWVGIGVHCIKFTGQYWCAHIHPCLFPPHFLVPRRSWWLGRPWRRRRHSQQRNPFLDNRTSHSRRQSVEIGAASFNTGARWRHGGCGRRGCRREHWIQRGRYCAHEILVQRAAKVRIKTVVAFGVFGTGRSPLILFICSTSYPSALFIALSKYEARP